MASSGAQNAVETCYFLDKIPGELRNRIYEYALVGQDGEAVLKYCVLVPSHSDVTEADRQEAKRKRLNELNLSIQRSTKRLEQVSTDLEKIDAQIKAREEFVARDTRGTRFTSNVELKIRKLRSERMAPDRTASSLRSSIAENERLKQEILSGKVRVEPSRLKSPLLGSPFAVKDGQVKKEREAFRDETDIFALSRTCRQIHEECSGLVYEYNKIKFITAPFSISASSAALQLKHILARQTKSGELQQGVIIDAGECYPSHSCLGADSYVSANQESLRKLRKSCESLELHFHMKDVRPPRQDQPQRDPIVCKLVVDSPESVVTQIDGMLAAEPQRLDARDIWSFKTILIKTFWPLWAGRNLL